MQTFGLLDLRRTAASMMAEMGITRFTIARILNHADATITGVYDRYSYVPEMRHALDAWGSRLAKIVSGESAPSNVVALERQRA